MKDSQNVSNSYDQRLETRFVIHAPNEDGSMLHRDHMIIPLSVLTRLPYTFPRLSSFGLGQASEQLSCTCTPLNNTWPSIHLFSKFILDSSRIKNHRQYMTMVCQLNEEMAPGPRQTDHLNAESRGRLSLPMVVGDFARARDILRFCFTITQQLC